jgi:CheY-like chemotaxis protein
MFKKVMVVDDNEVDRFVAQHVIKLYSLSQDVVCVESARDALEHLMSVEDTPDELPEIIFLDINMPEMSGFDFLNEYEKLSENIKKNCIIMMLTTSLNENDRQMAENNKYVLNFLNKPLNKEKIDNFNSYMQK